MGKRKLYEIETAGDYSASYVVALSYADAERIYQEEHPAPHPAITKISHINGEVLVQDLQED